MKQYSPRERFACGLLAGVCLLAAGFWTYFLLTDSGTRKSVLAWATGFGFWGGFAICLKIAITARSTARLEQDAADARWATGPTGNETARLTFIPEVYHRRGFLGLLRAAARGAVVVGAFGSVGLMLRAGRSTPRLLLVLFVFWVVSPFVALAWANMASERWSVMTRTTLYCVTLVITAGTLVIYGFDLTPAGSARAFSFVAVPPGSWLLMAVVVPGAALPSRRRSRA